MTVKFVLDGYDAIVNAADLPAAIAHHPSLRTIDLQGQKLARLPYNHRAVMAYRMAGLDIPSPMRTRYQWPKIQGRWNPRMHQVHTSEFIVNNPECFVLNEIGTGKTYSALWAADYLMREGLVRKCLIISPLSTLRRVWADSVFSTFQGRTCGVLHGDAKKRRKILAQEHDFYVINPDGLGVICEKTYNKDRVLESVRMAREDIDMVIVDEVGMFRHGGSLRWAVLRKIIEFLKPAFLVGMTGTPIPNEPADAWAQIRLIRPNNVPRYFTVFKRTVMQQVSQFKWVALPNAAQTVYNAMRPAIRYTRDDCLDLPPVVYSERECELSDQQKQLLKDLAKDMVVKLDRGEKISTANEGAKRTKFLQIACGVVYGDKGSVIELDCKPRLAALEEIGEQAAGKIIVFVPFTGALDMVARHLRSKGEDVEVVNGETSPATRDEIFSRFQATPSPRWLVADAGCMSHGLTLTEASTIVWYGPEESNDTHEQANGRITREGQKHIGTFIYLFGTATEREVFKRVKGKQSLQGSMLAMVRQDLAEL